MGKGHNYENGKKSILLNSMIPGTNNLKVWQESGNSARVRKYFSPDHLEMQYSLACYFMQSTVP